MIMPSELLHNGDYRIYRTNSCLNWIITRKKRFVLLKTCNNVNRIWKIVSCPCDLMALRACVNCARVDYPLITRMYLISSVSLSGCSHWAPSIAEPSPLSHQLPCFSSKATAP